jgi:NAD(P)H-hydrate epimerase
MKILTAAEMREADRITSERFRVPSLQLMENAGTRVVEFLRGVSPNLAKSKTVVLCGKGNNGGDGLVVARLLRKENAPATVYLFAEPDVLKGDAAANWRRWREARGDTHIVKDIREWELARKDLSSAELVIDALLGTGLNGPVEGLLAQVIEDTNQLAGHARVVAVDMPSGLASDGADFGGPVIQAEFTVTFTAPKIGQLLSPRASCVGELRVVEIGTPQALLDDDKNLRLHWLEPGEFRSLPLRRAPEANKGSYGHALIVSGSLGKTGAAVLTARGALRAGAGLVTVATPETVLPIVAAGAPELMTAPLPATDTGSTSLRSLEYGRFTELLNGKNVLAVGPGLSTHPETQQFIRAILADCTLPIILDADGLNAFAGRSDELAKRKRAPLAVTPHPGEMARLLGCTVKEVQADRLNTALKAAARWQATVVLKGFHTIVASPDGRAFVNSTGNPGMATGGTGDVLTGILAGLTAQFGTGAWETVLGFGVYLHGLAGDLAAERVGQHSLIASDLVESLPAAFARVMAELDRVRK